MELLLRTTVTDLHAEADRLVAQAREQRRSVIYVEAPLARMISVIAADILVRTDRAVSLDEWSYTTSEGQIVGRAVRLLG